MAKVEKCLICDDTVDIKFKPFCSMRCKDIDLGKWFSEGYRIPTEEKLTIVNSNQIEVDEG